MSWSICMYLLKKFHKLIRGIFIPQYGLQKLKVSRDLEKLVYKVVETPWITPYAYTHGIFPFSFFSNTGIRRKRKKPIPTHIRTNKRLLQFDGKRNSFILHNE